MRIVMMGIALVLAAATAEAGVPDNLQCYEISNANLRGLRGVVDLESPAFGLAPGCKVSRPKLYCVAADARVQPGTLTDGGHPIDELPYQGRPADTDRICYAVKCPYPVGSAPDQVVTDRFGTHGFKQLRTEMMCMPAIGGTLPPPRGGFQVKFPAVDIQPGQDITYCYHFRTPNDSPLPIHRFTSEMGPHSQQLVAFTVTDGSAQRFPKDRLPPGTVSTVDCGPLPTNGTMPHWIYSASEPESELVFPSDDGTGKPLALEIPPLSSGYIMLHTVNTTNDVIKAEATLNFEPLEAAAYTKTDTYLGFSSGFALPPYSSGVVETKSCPVPPDAQFWSLTTLAHGRAVNTRILDGTSLLLDSSDWRHPVIETVERPPFVTFSSKKLTYACRFDNPSNRTIYRGDSYVVDEECLAVGYFFPATRPLACSEGFGPY